MIEIIKDIDLSEHFDKYDAILIGTNTYNTLSQGIQRKVMLHYPYVNNKNMSTKYGDKNKMGTILECTEEGKPTFILCYISIGYNFRPDIMSDYLSYESLEKCLKLINILYKGKKLACPLLGGSRFDGNGDRKKIIDIIYNNMRDVDVTIYDYYQKSKQEESKERYELEKALKEKDKYEYYKAVSKRKEQENKIKELNGHTKR